MGKVTKPKEDKIPETTGGRIEYIRRNALVSQKELADLLGVKREYLSMIEADDRIPKIDMIKIISNRFNVTCDFLLCCSDVAVPDESKQAATKRLGLSEKAQENLENIMRYLSKYATAYKRAIGESVLINNMAPDIIDSLRFGDMSSDEIDSIEFDIEESDEIESFDFDAEASDEVESFDFDAEWKYSRYEDFVLGLNILLTTDQGFNILRQLDAMFSADVNEEEKNYAFAEIIDYLSQLKHLHKGEGDKGVGGY